MSFVQLPAATPPAPAPAPAAAPAAGGGSRLASNRNLLLVGGAVAVAAIGLISARRAPAAPQPETFTPDTRDTDLYNDLQPELEGISDRLDYLEKPPTPDPVTPVPPKPNPPSPKPSPPRNYLRYTVKAGDTLTKIGKAYKVSPTVLYTNNKGVIDAKQKAHNRKPNGAATTLYVGTTLTIPTNQPGQRGAGPIGF